MVLVLLINIINISILIVDGKIYGIYLELYRVGYDNLIALKGLNTRTIVEIES